VLHEFLIANRRALIERCRKKVGRRSSPPVTSAEIEEGVPHFIDQLVEALRHEAAHPAPKRDGKFDFSTEIPALAESSRTAKWHGQKLLEGGYSVEQVVHDYGDICQALTELATEEKASIAVEEFRTLNRLLDNAIADAVSSYEHDRDEMVKYGRDSLLHEQMGTLAEEQRRLIYIALRAFDALKVGNIGVLGATGMVLEDSLRTLRDLVDKSLPEIRLSSGMTTPGKR